MNNKVFSRLALCVALILFGCSKDNRMSSDVAQKNQEQASKTAMGARQLSGVGYNATTGECEPLVTNATYAVKMTGDLNGCLYVFIDNYQCAPSGTYREKGREYFVGMYHGITGTFWTAYQFEAKYEGCAVDGAPLGAEIFGRCQHPIVKGSGTGGFEGVTGRLDFRDNVDAGNFPYKGHLQF